MKHLLPILLTAALALSSAATAAGGDGRTKRDSTSRWSWQKIDDEIDNDIVPLAGKQGIRFQTKAGDFLFKPYMLVQTMATLNHYDDEGLDLADQDNVANSGFAIPNAIIGFSGKAFRVVTFNIAVNAAKSGGELLQQAWFDAAVSDAFRVKVGKFKVPFTNGYLATLGQTLFPALPLSMTAAANLNMSINSVPPVMNLGFDVGVNFHGLVKDRFEYNVGIFNGTGSGVNGATNTMHDDRTWLPSLLYAARVAYMPWGKMPTHQGSPDDLHNNKLLFALAANYNAEAEYESSDDLRLGAEVEWLHNRLMLSAEFYYLRMNWTKRMQRSDAFNSWGGYVQVGYFVTPKAQAALRYDLFDRNGTARAGIINMPAVGFNYYFVKCNLKLQAMYQYLGKWGHATQLDRDNDDAGLAMHSATVMLQYTF